MSPTRAPSVLAEVTRGSSVESHHLGHIAVVSGDDRLRGAIGDPDLDVFLRSSAKPVQALPALVEGAADRFGFSDEEVALACGSHEGEPVHVETARRMLGRIGLGPDALRCGLKAPLNEAVAEALTRDGRAPSTLHNECSGEHALMLALTVHIGAPTETYTEPGHPVQRLVRAAVGRFTDVDPVALRSGTDGCRIPTFAVPLRAAALLAARLVCPPASWDVPTRDACSRLVRAMTAYPEMVDGTRPDDLLDSALMRSTEGRLVSKMGAEGLLLVGVRPSEAYPDGLGIAVKVVDGDPDERARSPIAVALLRRLGVLSDGAFDRLTPHQTTSVTDNEGECVGEVRPAPFDLAGL